MDSQDAGIYYKEELVAGSSYDEVHILNKLAPAHVRPLPATFAYYAAFIILGMTTAISGPALPWLAKHTASSLDLLSAIFIAGSLGYITGSQIGGWAYDRFPGHRIQAIMLLGIALAAALVPIVRSLWYLVAIIFFLGAVQGSLDVGCNALLTWIHGDKVRPFMNGLHFFFGVGSFAAPLIFARVVLITGDILWVYWLFSLMALPVALWLWMLPSPEIRRHAQHLASRKPSPGLVIVFMAFFAAYVGMELGFGNWIYTYAYRLNLADAAVAAYLTSAFWGSFMVGRLLGIGISARLRPQTILILDLAGCLAGFGIILFWPASSPALWISTVVLGLSMASVFATTMALAEKRLGLTGSITGWFLVGSGIGGMFFPWLIGQLFERFGPRATMPVNTFNALLTICLLVVLIAPKPKRKSTSG
jgi:MFS transporter, FHS family, Na+ dependent glucose transporter 1